MSTVDIIARLRAMVAHVADAALVAARPVADLMREAADALESAAKRTAEDERRDICRLIVKRMDALSLEEARIVRHQLPHAEGVLAMQSIGAQRFALDALERAIANGDHEGAADR